MGIYVFILSLPLRANARVVLLFHGDDVLSTRERVLARRFDDDWREAPAGRPRLHRAKELPPTFHVTSIRGRSPLSAETLG